jgi:hypothetical protein
MKADVFPRVGTYYSSFPALWSLVACSCLLFRVEFAEPNLTATCRAAAFGLVVGGIAISWMLTMSLSHNEEGRLPYISETGSSLSSFSLILPFLFNLVI